MKMVRGFGVLALSALVWAAATQAVMAQSKPSHLRLVDRLDRPSDGYCFDIPGTPGNLRLDVPLFAHNCKPRLTTDSAMVLTGEGTLLFPAPNRCVTVAGTNSGGLPGASLLLRPCGEATLFFETAALQ